MLALLFTLLTLLAPPALADEEAPEFLLADVGVRIELPAGWRMTRWSDWDFRAERQGMMLFAWATPVQAAPADDALEPWTAHWLKQAESTWNLREAELLDAEVQQAHEVSVARGRLEFRAGDRDTGRALLASLPIEGQVFHLAVITTAPRERQATAAMDALVGELEIHRPAAPVQAGATLQAEGITTTLPAGWREALPSELAVVRRKVAPLGLEDLSPCWTALRPQGPERHDLLVTCQGGLWLGVVDSHTFADREQVVRERMFGQAPIGTAEPLQLADRLGFLYRGTEELPLVVGVVPYDQGLARAWALTEGGDLAGLEASVREVLDATQFSGDHPVSPLDLLWYYPAYRPFHPVTLCPIFALLGVVTLLVGFMLFRARRNPYEDIE